MHLPTFKLASSFLYETIARKKDTQYLKCMFNVEHFKKHTYHYGEKYLFTLYRTGY